MTRMSRVTRVREQMDNAGVDAVVVTNSTDLQWLTGVSIGGHERPTACVVTADRCELLAPILEVAEVRRQLALEVDVATWADGDDPHTVISSMLATSRRVAANSDMRARVLLGLQNLRPDTTWTDAQQVIGPVRAVKDPQEVDALRRVGAAIDRVHEQVPSVLRAGITEAAAGAAISELIETEHDTVEFVIVASGPNGASPHHELSDRTLQAGDLVVVDIGGRLDGYCSDSTRTYGIEEVDDDAIQIHEHVVAAQRAAVAAVKPGVSAESIDRVARTHLADVGLAEHFIHRTGHGIGLDVHENPYIVEGNAQTLEPGHAFSIEPGVYLPQRLGVRIEDIVIATDDGVTTCNASPHDIVVCS